MSLLWTQKETDTLKDLIKEGLNALDISKKKVFPGKSYDSIFNKIKRIKEKEEILVIDKGEENIENLLEEKISTDFSENAATVTTRSVDITSLEKALEVGKVDLDVWEVERHVINSWEVTMGGSKTASGVPETFTNFQVKVWLKRKILNSFNTAVENLCKKMEKSSLIIKPPRSKSFKKDLCMHELCLFDAHYGKLAWGDESGDNCDIKIANSKYVGGVEDLLNKGAVFNVEKIVFPLGQDFLHIDNPENETSHGTRQDHDGRLIKVFEAAIQTCITVIKMCLEQAPVEVIWVPGNHDAMSSYYLCRVLKSHFLGTKHINVDVGPKVRKYIKYGINLIGYTHGSEEKMASLPTIMASEQPKEWADSQIREWHVGHTHRKRQMSYTTSDTFNAVHVKVIPSMTSTDAWHFKKGYVKTVKVAQSFMWSALKGNIATFDTDYLREDVYN